MKFRRLLATGSLLLLSATASADTITFDNIVASWININPNNIEATNNGTGTPSMRWGTDIGNGQSGYDFVAATPPPFDVDVDPGSLSPIFDLGAFTHLNNPIIGTSLSSVTLQIVATIANVGDLMFEYDFLHNETPNGDDPCENGEANGAGVNVNGCADIVTFMNNVAASDSFMIGDDAYTILITGFLVGNSLVDAFETIEGQDNTATIRAQIALAEPVASVPEPGTLALLGMGLVGIGLARRRRAV